MIVEEIPASVTSSPRISSRWWESPVYPIGYHFTSRSDSVVRRPAAAERCLDHADLGLGASCGPKIFLDSTARYQRAYSMALLVPPRVFKQLATMPKADARRLLDRLERIADAPEKLHPNVVPLGGESGVFRVRQGNWRAVFSIEKGDVIVDRVAHRREVYR